MLLEGSLIEANFSQVLKLLSSPSGNSSLSLGHRPQLRGLGGAQSEARQGLPVKKERWGTEGEDWSEEANYFVR